MKNKLCGYLDSMMWKALNQNRFLAQGHHPDQVQKEAYWD